LELGVKREAGEDPQAIVDGPEGDGVRVT